MEKITIQIWKSGASVWDDCSYTMHKVHNTSDASVLAQHISDASLSHVRMCFYREGIKVGSLNGGYFVPKAIYLNPKSI